MIDRSSVRWGFVLILLALLGAFFIPQASIPRLALSAHTVGLMSGLLLIVFGLISSHLALSATLVRGTRLLWIYSGFANWLGCFYGAWAGAGTMTPVASAGRQGSSLDEAIVSFLLISVAVTAVLAVVLTLYGLRARVGSN